MAWILACLSFGQFLCAQGYGARNPNTTCLEAPMQQIEFLFAPDSRRSVFGDGGRFELIYKGPFDLKHAVVGPGFWVSVNPVPLYLGDGFTILLTLNPDVTPEPGLLFHFEKANTHLLEILRDGKGFIAARGQGAAGDMWSIPYMDDKPSRPKQVALTCDGGYLRLYTDGIFRREGQCKAPMPLMGALLAIHHRGGFIPTVLRVQVYRQALSLDVIQNITKP